MSAQFLLGSPVGDIYAYALGAPLRSKRLYDPDYVLRQDPEAYAKLRRDAVVNHAVQYRKHLVAGRDWFLEAASTREEDRKVVALLEALISRLPRFAASRFHLAESVIRGSAWALIHTEAQELRLADDEKKRVWMVPIALQDASKFRFRLERPDGATQADIQEGRAPHRWQVQRPLQARWEDVDLDRWVHHVYDDSEDTLGYGRGLAEGLYHYWLAKTTAIEYGEQYLDRWAHGILRAGIDSLRQAATGVGVPVGPNALRADRDQATRAQAWVDKLNAMRHQHVIVHDKNDELEVIDAPTGGWTATREAVEYYDNCIRVLILGSNLPTSATEGGSFALAEIQENSTETLVGYDRTLLEETLTEQLVHRLFAWNAAVFKDLGLEHAEPPRFRFREDRQADPVQRAQVIAAARAAGLTLRRDEVYTQLGFTPPAPGDDVIEPGQPIPLPGTPGAMGLPTPGASGLPAAFRAREEDVTKKELENAFATFRAEVTRDFMVARAAFASPPAGPAVSFPGATVQLSPGAEADLGTKITAALADGAAATRELVQAVAGIDPTVNLPEMRPTITPAPVRVVDRPAPAITVNAIPGAVEVRSVVESHVTAEVKLSPRPARQVVLEGPDGKTTITMPAEQ